MSRLVSRATELPVSDEERAKVLGTLGTDKTASLFYNQSLWQGLSGAHAQNAAIEQIRLEQYDLDGIMSDVEREVDAVRFYHDKPEFEGQFGPLGSGSEQDRLPDRDTMIANMFRERKDRIRNNTSFHFMGRNIRRQKKSSQFMSPEEANKRLADLNIVLTEEQKFKDPVSFGEVEMVRQFRQEAAVRNNRLRTAESGLMHPANFIAAMGGAVSNPVDAVAMFIPFVGEAKFASLAAKIASRSVQGAAANLISEGIQQPFILENVKTTKADYDLTMAIHNTVMAGAFGAILPAAVSGLGKGLQLTGKAPGAILDKMAFSRVKKSYGDTFQLFQVEMKNRFGLETSLDMLDEMSKLKPKEQLGMMQLALTNVGRGLFPILDEAWSATKGVRTFKVLEGIPGMPKKVVLKVVGKEVVGTLEGLPEGIKVAAVMGADTVEGRADVQRQMARDFMTSVEDSKLAARSEVIAKAKESLKDASLKENDLPQTYRLALKKKRKDLANFKEKLALVEKAKTDAEAFDILRVSGMTFKEFVRDGGKETAIANLKRILVQGEQGIDELFVKGALESLEKTAKNLGKEDPPNVKTAEDLRKAVKELDDAPVIGENRFHDVENYRENELDKMKRKEKNEILEDNRVLREEGDQLLSEAKEAVDGMVAGAKNAAEADQLRALVKDDLDVDGVLKAELLSPGERKLLATADERVPVQRQAVKKIEDNIADLTIRRDGISEESLTKSSIRRPTLISILQKLDKKFDPEAKVDGKDITKKELVKRILIKADEGKGELPAVVNPNKDKIKVGDVTFDPVDGLGQTPKQQVINSSGFVVFLKPEEFRGIAAPRPLGAKASLGFLEKKLDEGESFAPPFIEIRPDKQGRIVITGHEGRTRSEVLMKRQPDEPIPVHVFLKDGSDQTSLGTRGLAFSSLKKEFFFIEDFLKDEAATKALLKQFNEEVIQQGSGTSRKGLGKKFIIDKKEVGVEARAPEENLDGLIDKAKEDLTAAKDELKLIEREAAETILEDTPLTIIIKDTKKVQKVFTEEVIDKGEGVGTMDELKKVLKKAMLKENIKPKDASDIIKYFEINHRHLVRGGSEGDALRMAAENAIAQQEHIALVTRRNAAMNLRKDTKIIESISKDFPDDPIKGFRVLFSGGYGNFAGEQSSVYGRMGALIDDYMSTIEGKLRRVKLDSGKTLWDMFMDKGVSKQIFSAVWSLDTKLDGIKDFIVKATDEAPPKFGKEVEDIAQILHEVSDIARRHSNDQGADIQRLRSYVIRQSMRIEKILPTRFKTGEGFFKKDLDLAFKNWSADMKEWLDFDMSIGSGDPKDIDQFLKDVFSGYTEGFNSKSKGEGGIIGGGIDVGRTLSEGRALHYKDADSAFDAMTKYGSGDFVGSFFSGLTEMARKTALMESFGTNPEKSFNRIVKGLRTKLTGTKGALKIKSLDEVSGGSFGVRRLRNQFQELTGESRIPASNILAQVGQGIRVIQNLAKMGSSFITAGFSDPWLMTRELQSQGFTPFQSWSEFFSALPKKIAKTDERRELLSMIGVFSESYGGRVANRYTIEDALPGAMSKINQGFFKYSGLTPWTDALKEATAMAVSHRLAINKSKAWGLLDPELRGTLNAFNITEPKWKLFGGATDKAADGRLYMTPEGLDKVSDSAYRRAFLEINKSKTKVSDLDLRTFKQEVRLDLRTYIAESMRLSVNEPGLRVRSDLRFGLKRGTILGEFAALITQFKPFPLAMMDGVFNKQLNQNFLNEADRHFLSAWKKGQGGVLGVARMGMALSVAGYLAQSSSDLLNNKSLRDPTELSTIKDAIIRGGTLGVWGDMTLGMDPRFSRTELCRFHLVQTLP